MFIGRENELNVLQSFLDDATQKSLLLYGKRRIGKTELIRELFRRNNKKYIYFECTKDSLKANIDGLIDVLIQNNILEQRVSATTFDELFYFIKIAQKPCTIVIDEYPYLYEFTDGKIIDSQFQKIIDNHLTQNKLIITGSNVSVMNSLLSESNALFGRFNKKLLLRELPYTKTQLFYPNKTIYEKIGFHSIFGGSPFVNKAINPKLSLEENIKSTFLDENSDVYTYCNYILFTDVASSMNINGLCNILKNGRKSCAEIENSLSVERNGGMNKKLATLIEMELISKVQPINKLGNNKASKYEINDNAIRFFYSFVYPNKSFLIKFGVDFFYDNFIKDQLTTFISHRFEEIVRNYFISQVSERKITNVINVGSYSYDDPKTKTSGEFDVAMLLTNEKYKIVEVKYYKDGNILTTKEMNVEQAQVNSIRELKIDSLAFICTSGYEKNNAYECIDINNLYY